MNLIKKNDCQDNNNGNPIEKCYENYILIDIGAYLIHKKYQKDLESVIMRAKDAGIQKIISLSMSVHGSKESMRLSHLYPDYIYCAVGIHPHEAKQWNDDTYHILHDLAKKPECVAIGECGLDFNRDFSPQSIQKFAFEEQVKLACELGKPLVLHERDAHLDMVSILSKYQPLPGGVVHCFTGSIEHAKTYLQMGLHIAVTGYCCKDKSEDGVRALLQKGIVPLDRLLVESDAPYMFANTQAAKLPPHVLSTLTDKSSMFLNRYCTFQRNEPCSLPALVELVAGLVGDTPQNIALHTAFNSIKLFFTQDSSKPKSR